MGGWFSSSKPEPPLEPKRLPAPSVANRYRSEQTLADIFSSLSLNDGKRYHYDTNNIRPQVYCNEPILRRSEPKRVQIMWSLNNSFANAYGEDVEYVRSLITNKNIIIDSVKAIVDNYLLLSYELKKLQKALRYPNFQEQILFHGTKRSNITSICKNNFDWRKSVGHLFGQGVSFSCNAMYASNYSDDAEWKIFIIAKVLIGSTCNGHRNMVIPVNGTDTALKNNSNVVTVKFEDAEYLPIYLVEYHYRLGYVPNRGTQNKAPNRNILFHNNYYLQ